MKLCSPVLVLSLLLLCAATVTLGSKKPEHLCKHRCKDDERLTEHEKVECIEECERYYRDKKKQEQWKEEDVKGKGEEQEEEINPYVLIKEEDFEPGHKTDLGSFPSSKIHRQI